MLRLFHGKSDIVDLALRHYHGVNGWDTARFDEEICCVPPVTGRSGGTGWGRATSGTGGTGTRPGGGSGSGDNTVKIFNLSTGKRLKTLEGHSADINNVSFSPDCTMIASCSGVPGKTTTALGCGMLALQRRSSNALGTVKFSRRASLCPMARLSCQRIVSERLSCHHPGRRPSRIVAVICPGICP